MRPHHGTGGTRASRAALIDRRLRAQLGIFATIYLIMTVLVSERLIRGDVDPLWAPAGFVAGLALGFVLSRTKVLGWDETEGTVVGRSDALGIAILIAYLVFVIFRDRIISAGVDDADTVGIIGLSMTAGAMLGRVYATRRGIRRILAGAGIAPLSGSE